MITTIFNRALRVMKYVMPVFYLAVGVALTFTDFFAEEAGKFRQLLGILLIGYAVFRTWRVIRDPANTKEDEPLED